MESVNKGIYKYLYHACSRIYNNKHMPINFGEGFHYSLDQSALEKAMPKLRDKSIIVRYEVKNDLIPLRVRGDLGGWFSYDIAELLIANIEHRDVESDYLIADQPIILSDLELDNDELVILKAIKQTTYSLTDFDLVFSILKKHGYNCIEYNYIEGDNAKSICLNDLDLINLNSAKKVFSNEIL